MNVPIVVRIAVLTVASTAFYAYVGQLLPQKEVQPPEETHIERWHGVDERVSIDGLRWGLPVLYDAVRRFCE